MFLLKGDKIAMNEIAPRPHNSGHWTIDACATSQFEQSIRAVCDLPLGAVTVLASARMKNLLGDDIDNYLDILSDPSAKLHLYGKTEAKPGRKMGHVTRIAKK
jgi:5-(carboxyamino)imidazole ribonucleotide synthase